ncbi:hypothetical protein CesoFtcFv8_027221 [Champsocephalus esox]|uniref:Uncharacterized protein n=1 Tax=Champsocephalus esox TaxID=159716 RepID=A0AAN8GB80_9TELE|nr:hypothetical protein CesoFtcFv8_027221 [Champsocephalus esox]
MERGPEMDLRVMLRRVSTALSPGPYVWVLGPLRLGPGAPTSGSWGPYVWVLGPRWELPARSTSDWTV